jgi:hypothetical protein
VATAVPTSTPPSSRFSDVAARFRGAGADGVLGQPTGRHAGNALLVSPVPYSRSFLDLLRFETRDAVALHGWKGAPFERGLSRIMWHATGVPKPGLTPSHSKLPKSLPSSSVRKHRLPPPLFRPHPKASTRMPRAATTKPSIDFDSKRAGGGVARYSSRHRRLFQALPCSSAAPFPHEETQSTALDAFPECSRVDLPGNAARRECERAFSWGRRERPKWRRPVQERYQRVPTPISQRDRAQRCLTTFGIGNCRQISCCCRSGRDNLVPRRGRPNGRWGANP